MKIYVGNLSYGVTDDDIRAVFSASGEVSSVSIIKDRVSGESKGFAFIDMPNESDANAAIKALNEQPLNGRNMRVNEARPRDERPARRN